MKTFRLLLVIDFSDQYKTIHCKSKKNKSSVRNKWYYIHTYHNELENRTQFIDKFPKTFYSVNYDSIMSAVSHNIESSINQQMFNLRKSLSFSKPIQYFFKLVYFKEEIYSNITN